MTRSMTLTKLPRAGANSTAHPYEQKVQNQDLSKTWVLTGKQFEDFRQRRTETLCSTSQKNPVEHKDPERVI